MRYRECGVVYDHQRLLVHVISVNNPKHVNQKCRKHLMQCLQRTTSERVWVKQQVPWPQNFILEGPNKDRVNYDSLSVHQWISVFCQIVKEELNSDTKNAMLDYISDLMDDAQEFGWNPAKACHAVMLCSMEEGKIVWQDTAKIDMIRRSHVQRSSNSQSGPGLAHKKSSDGGNLYKFYQNQSCPQKGDHTTGGQNYKHICAICNAYGRKMTHLGLRV